MRQGGGQGLQEAVMLRGGSSMCHPHILAALLLINFSHDHSQSQYIKHEGLGGLGICTPSSELPFDTTLLAMWKCQ